MKYVMARITEFTFKFSGFDNNDNDSLRNSIDILFVLSFLSL
jgi:hypothetical protein